jgi:AcrR family transcriptional regulator
MITRRARARRELHREELKAEIREGARAIFVRDGYQAFSMRKLAAEIGYSPAAVYLYFTSKEALFRSLVEESFARLLEVLEGLSARPGADPVARLKRGLRLYVDWGLEHPDDYQVAFLLPEPAQGPYRPHPAFDVLRTMLSACLPDGGARGARVEKGSRALWSAVHGVTSLLIQRPNFPWGSREAVVRQVIDSAVDGAIIAGTTTKRPRR